VPSTTLPTDYLLSSRNTLHTRRQLEPAQVIGREAIERISCDVGGRNIQITSICEKEEKEREVTHERWTRPAQIEQSRLTSYLRSAMLMMCHHQGKGQPRCFLTRPDLGRLLHQLQHFVRSTAFIAITSQRGYSAQMGYTR
jgi:hypothetical protein